MQVKGDKTGISANQLHAAMTSHHSSSKIQAPAQNVGVFNVGVPGAINVQCCCLGVSQCSMLGLRRGAGHPPIARGPPPKSSIKSESLMPKSAKIYDHDHIVPAPCKCARVLWAACYSACPAVAPRRTGTQSL